MNSENASFKVLLFIGGLDSGGAERQFVLLAKGLKQRGVDVRVLLNRPGGQFFAEIEQAGIPIEVLFLGRFWSLPGYYLRGIGALKRIKPSIVYGFIGAGIKATFFAFFCSNVKVVWGVRSSDISAVQISFATQFAKYLDRSLSRFANSIVFNSNAGLVDRVSLGWTCSHSVVIANGIDTDKFNFDATTRNAIRQQWCLNDSQYAIGMFARIDTLKDHTTLIKAFSIMANLDSKLIIVGSGDTDLADSLKQLVSELGIAEHVLWVANTAFPEHLLCGLDLYVHSSITEGFPNAVAEAMSTGLPVVVTDVGDCRQLIGNFGWIVDFGNPAQLANAIESAIDALPSWNGALSRQHIIQNYSIDCMVDKTLSHLVAVSKIR